MSAITVNPPDVQAIAVPLLSYLPGAAVSTKPVPTVLPLLSPILRQRVQLLSDASREPWIRLLTYDTSKVPRLTEIAQGGTLEPHPVSGEVEVDWDHNVQIKYRRLDQETLETLLVLDELDLSVRLVYCTGDKNGDGDSDGWRVGEVGVASNPSPLGAFGGSDSISEAEKAFKEVSAAPSRPLYGAGTLAVNGAHRAPSAGAAEDDDEDDDYWGRYDATPSRTPAAQRSPAPQSTTQNAQSSAYRSASAEDAYYAQYDSVQPAMDPHDPDEVVEGIQVPPPLGLARPAQSHDAVEGAEINETSGAWTLADHPRSPSAQNNDGRATVLLHPRPESSASSNGSQTIAKLEESAEKQDHTEFGVKQHVSRSIRSLFLLSRSSGIDREEFERMVKTELDVLGMVEDDI